MRPIIRILLVAIISWHVAQIEESRCAFRRDCGRQDNRSVLRNLAVCLGFLATSKERKHQSTIVRYAKENYFEYRPLVL